MCGYVAVHAFQCALLLVSLVFGQVFFGGSAFLHDRLLHFLAKSFFCNVLVLGNIFEEIV